MLVSFLYGSQIISVPYCTTVKHAKRKSHRLGQIKAFFGRYKDGISYLPEEGTAGTSRLTKLTAAWLDVIADGKRAKETAAVEKNKLSRAAAREFTCP